MKAGLLLRDRDSKGERAVNVLRDPVLGSLHITWGEKEVHTVGEEDSRALDEQDAAGLVTRDSRQRQKQGQSAPSPREEEDICHLQVI